MRVIRSAIAVMALTAACGFSRQAAAAAPADLHSFCQFTDCQDGSLPSGGLVEDAEGNLFGMTTYGGNPNDAGLVYEIVRHPRRGTARFRILHEFCLQPSCTDGANPAGQLVIDRAGDLYGVASGGGYGNSGVAFRMIRQSGHDAWSYQTFYDFCTRENCGNGSVPMSGFTYAGAYSGAPYDGTSPLYGMTSRGGRYGAGVVYVFQTGGRMKTLYHFCPDVGTCAGGGSPQYAPVLDDAGNIYGMAAGGSHQAGVVFKLSPGTGRKYSESVLHDFCSSANCADGAGPNALALDAAGNLFGTAYYGGKIGSPCTQGCGTSFKIASGGAFSLLHTFCAQADCPDGWWPVGVTLTPSGDIYGVTRLGGRGDGGTIFRMAASFHTLTSFCRSDCSAVAYPATALLQDGAGKLFGLTSRIDGAVYEYVR